MRSFLFVPGDSERKLAKGPSSGPDALILDLEDSVASDRKKLASEMVQAYLKSADRKGPKLYVRVNALDTQIRSLRQDADAARMAASDELRRLIGAG